ncbi:MAG: amino acid adenylation domain-containing protein [Ktedonobacteraceae bacterium]|nr:amino acid adenylation domain-containing protein [Ktedonobacteraceae bacterium]
MTGLTNELLESQSLLTIERMFTERSDTSNYTLLTGQITCLANYFEQTCDQRPDRIAVVCADSQYTYQELDQRANRLAHLLLKRGVAEGQPVGILLERSLDTYVALLGVLKAGAAFVPLDSSFPADRVAFIAQDAGLRDVVTTSSLHEKTQGLACSVLTLDAAWTQLAVQPASRPHVNVDPSSLCYIIYTSGTTGKPKGVAVSHASITHFLRVVTPIYAVSSDDRVYQGITIAFDFSFEEIWPTWIAGATLIAGFTDSRRLGQGLTAFLIDQQITVLCCVPTLLSTIESDVPSLRCLLVGGEACPADLVCRWSKPGRRMLNTYGPTETTVTATCGELLPGRPVTLGTPLPTYRIYLLDQQLHPVEQSSSGEICIGGPGVAIGYHNRPELTSERFVPNPFPHDRAEVPRLYRSGDLGRLTASGEIEYLGRIDTQVKIRGYRIELGEIEDVLRQDQAVKQAIVLPREGEGIVEDLISYVTLHDCKAPDAQAALRERLHASLRHQLPPYMVPSFIEVLDAFPLLAADKVDCAAFPPPTSPPLGLRSGPYVPAQTPLEGQLAAVWGQVLGCAEVSVEDDFFCDLGGHSLTAARLISQLRRQPELQGLSIGDLYAQTTIRTLARFIETDLAAPTQQQPATPQRPTPRQHSTARVLGCGLVQFVVLYSWMFLLTAPLLGLLYAVSLLLGLPTSGLLTGSSILAHHSGFELLASTVVWFGVTIVLLPAVGGRVIMRGVRPGWYPLWGVTYLRWWFYNKVLALSPVSLLAGSPLLPPYLRLLGARLGRDCHLATGSIVGTPLFVDIGDGVSIGYGARVLPHVVEDGWLRLAPIRLAAGSFVGTSSVVLAGAEIGSNASVGEQSLVPADHVISANEHWVGSPLTRLPTAPRLLETMAAKADDHHWPITVLIGFLVGALLLWWLPLLMMVPSALLVDYVTSHAGLSWGIASVALAAPLFVVVSCTIIIVGKRSVMPVAHAGIYCERSGLGLRKWLSDHLIAISTSMLTTLYDTLYLKPFLRLLGARLGRWSEISIVSFIDPDMLTLGDESFLAGATVIAPPVFYRGCIALGQVEVGRRSFVGNGAIVPGSTHIGDNSLLGVHSVPPARSMDPETTWLGSPAIFLPHRQASERFPEELTFRPRPSLVAWRLAIEYFTVTLPSTIMGLSMLVDLFVTIRLVAVLSPLAMLALMPALVLGLGVVCVLVVVLLKWLIVGRYRPRVEPMWSVWVRRTELITGLYSSVATPMLVSTLGGTPWLAPFLRLLGARIGRRTWLNSIATSEFDLLEIGDDASVADEAGLQTHLYEDRVMKMSRVKVGQASSIGALAVVLYDAEVGAGACLDAQTLVMKGESVPADSRWRGIPARPC